MSRPQPAERSAFNLFYPLSTRWADNDVYGHANNVVYYAWFDTVVNQFLIEHGGMRPGEDTVVGYVVSSSCNYFGPVSYPQSLELGLRVERLGERSVTWELGVFLPGEVSSRATGSFTHAFVDRNANTSAPLPTSIRSAIERTFGNTLCT